MQGNGVSVALVACARHIQRIVEGEIASLLGCAKEEGVEIVGLPLLRASRFCAVALELGNPPAPLLCAVLADVGREQALQALPGM